MINKNSRRHRGTQHAVKLPLALALALGASHAHALGLGQIEVKSRLNQPLVAEIPLITASASEADNLRVRLASPEAFARVGLERPAMMAANLSFSVAKNIRGQPVIRITTDSQVSDPFLNFLLEVEWGKGQLVREFTALLDPPYLAPAIVQRGPAPAPVELPPAPVAESIPAAAEPIAAEPAPSQTTSAETTSAEPVAAAPEPALQAEPPQQQAPDPIAAEAPPAALVDPPLPPQPDPVAAQAPPEAPPVAFEPQAEPAPSPAAVGEFGPVAQGQTLSEIAGGVRPEGVSVNQMMVAIQQANPKAFIDGNINLIKRGSVLRIPGADELAALTDAEAAALVRQQNADWRQASAPVLQPAEAVADATVTVPPAATAAPSVDPDGRLEIVPAVAEGKTPSGGQSGASASGGGAELRAELSEAKETLAAREAEVQELRSRLQEQERLQADREKLIELNNSQLQALQQRLAELEKTPAVPPATDATLADAPSAATDATAAAVATPLDGAAAAIGPDPGAVPEMAPPVEPTPGAALSELPPPVATEPAATLSPEPAIEPAAAPAAATPEPVVQTPWYMQPLTWAAAAVLVLAALVMVAVRRRRARQTPRRGYDSASLAEGITPPPAVVPAMHASGTDAQTPDEGEVLREAVDAAPADLDARLALIRYHHNRGDAVAVDEQVDAMSAQVADDSDPHWQEALALRDGAQTDAAVTRTSAATAGWPEPAEPAFDKHLTPTASNAGPVDAAAHPGPPVTYVDLNKHRWSAEYTNLPAPPDNAMMAVYDPPAVPSSSPDAAPASRSEPPSIAEAAWSDEAWSEAGRSAAARETSTFDAPEASQGQPLSAQPASVAADSIDTDASDAGQDETSATKLELARAYLDIGDAEGARGMLEEVLHEGRPGQRAEARRMLDEIG